MSATNKQSQQPTAASLTLFIDLSCVDEVHYSLVPGHHSSKGGSSTAAAGPIRPQRIYQTPLAAMVRPDASTCSTDAAPSLPSSMDSVWSTLRASLGIHPVAAPLGRSLPLGSNAESTTSTRLPYSHASIRGVVGAALGDALVQDEAQSIALANKEDGSNPITGKAAATAGSDGSLEGGSHIHTNAAREALALESLATRFKLLPLTACEVAVSDDPGIRAHINARIARVSSEPNAEPGLASLAVLSSYPQLSSLIGGGAATAASSTTSGKYPFPDVSVLVLLPNDPTGVPRVAKEAILNAVFSLDSVLLGPTATAPSSTVVSQRYFKLPLRISKVQLAFSAVASLHACGLHTGVVCHVDLRAPEKGSIMSLCAISNSQPVLPLCHSYPIAAAASGGTPTLHGVVVASQIRLFASTFGTHLQREMSMDVPAIACSPLPPTPTASGSGVVNHPLAHTQNLCELDASSLVALSKKFIVRITSPSSWPHNGSQGQAADQELLAGEFVAGFTGSRTQSAALCYSLSRLRHQDSSSVGSKREREEGIIDAAEGAPLSEFIVAPFHLPTSFAPKEVAALAAPGLCELVRYVPGRPLTAAEFGQPLRLHRQVTPPQAATSRDLIGIAPIVGGGVLVHLPSFDAYFSTTAAQFRKEGPAVSISRIPLDSR